MYLAALQRSQTTIVTSADIGSTDPWATVAWNSIDEQAKDDADNNCFSEATMHLRRSKTALGAAWNLDVKHESILESVVVSRCVCVSIRRKHSLSAQ